MFRLSKLTLLTHILLWTMWTRMNRCQREESHPSSKISLGACSGHGETTRRLESEDEVFVSNYLWTKLMEQLKVSFEVLVLMWAGMSIVEHDYMVVEHFRLVWWKRVLIFEHWLFVKRNSEHDITCSRVWPYRLNLDLMYKISKTQWEMTCLRVEHDLWVCEQKLLQSAFISENFNLQMWWSNFSESISNLYGPLTNLKQFDSS